MGTMDSWGKKAEEYYKDGLKITHIAALLDKPEKEISSYLKDLPGYGQLKEQHKESRARQRRKYKTEKQRQYRQMDSALSAVTPETVRREHELAAIELSRERYH